VTAGAGLIAIISPRRFSFALDERRQFPVNRPARHAPDCQSPFAVRGLRADYSLLSIQKWLFSPISALGKNFNPRNINHMPAVKIFARLELDETISFLDGR
jgi:hypothetical protein